MNIVMLEGDNLGDDVDLSAFKKLGNFIYYGATSQEQVADRVKDADIIIANKLLMNRDSLKDALGVRLICITATGINNVDLEYLSSRKIVLTNVAGYSSSSVAQHTFGMLFYLLEKLNYYDNYVKSKAYVMSSTFSHFKERFWELEGKVWGIIGMGAIGSKVADLASAFGCKVISYSPSGRCYDAKYEQVDFATILSKSDVLSLHTPLSEETYDLINLEALKRMKKSAILINVARGNIVNETDLCTALNQGMIAAAGLDVLGHEPITADNPLYSCKDSNCLLITPHIGWATIEARTRLVQEVYENVVAFLNGERRNVIEK